MAGAPDMGRQRPPSSVVLDEGDGLMLEIEHEAVRRVRLAVYADDAAVQRAAVICDAAPLRERRLQGSGLGPHPSTSLGVP